MPEIPFSIQWPIAEIRLFSLKDSIDGYVKSTHVKNIPEFEYYLGIRPNGYGECRGKTCIELQLEFKNVKKVEVECTFIIESANYSNIFHRIYEKSEGWGRLICSTDELFDPEKKYIVDGKFTIKVNGIFKFETEYDASTSFKQKWDGGKLGDEFWERNDNKDFTIITDEKKIEIHKLVLDIRSDVFAAMLNSNMKESTENKVEIPDFCYNVVEAALKIIYDCNFFNALSMDELMQLLQFF